jgi:DNA polymerase-3 subunit delta
MIGKQLSQLIDDFVSKNGDSIERFDGSELSDVDDLLDAVRSISFLEPRKLVVVRNFGQNKELLDKIEIIIEQTADSTDLLLVDEKLDKRTSVFKYLQKNVDVKVCKELEHHELEKWVIDEVEKSGGKISGSDVRFLIDRVGINQLRLKNEIDKLVLRSDEINKQSIEELVDLTPQGKVFAMLDELFRGNAKKAWELYLDQRLQGEEPQKIIGMITWQLQQLTYAVFAPMKTVAALTEVGMSPYTARNVLQQATVITKRNIMQFTKQLADIDAQSKTNADVESALAVYFSAVSSLRSN